MVERIVVSTYCAKAGRDVTVIIGIGEKGETVFVKVLCGYLYEGLDSVFCDKGGYCGLYYGAKGR